LSERIERVKQKNDKTPKAAGDGSAKAPPPEPPVALTFQEQAASSVAAIEPACLRQLGRAQGSGALVAAGTNSNGGAPTFSGISSSPYATNSGVDSSILPGMLLPPPPPPPSEAANLLLPRLGVPGLRGGDIGARPSDRASIARRLGLASLATSAATAASSSSSMPLSHHSLLNQHAVAIALHQRRLETERQLIMLRQHQLLAGRAQLLGGGGEYPPRGDNDGSTPTSPVAGEMSFNGTLPGARSF